MKRALLVLVAVLIGFALVTTAFAQEKAKTEKSVKLTGEVVSNDGKMMTVKGPKGEQNFDVSGVKKVGKYKVGDQVTISYKEKDGVLTASSIKKPLMKGKEKMETTESAEKPTPPAK